MPCGSMSVHYSISTPVECGVWLKIAVLFGFSVSVHCHNEFPMHHTAIFLVIYCILLHGNILILLNKITGFEHIHGTQYILDRKK